MLMSDAQRPFNLRFFEQGVHIMIHQIRGLVDLILTYADPKNGTITDAFSMFRPSQLRLNNEF